MQHPPPILMQRTPHGWLGYDAYSRTEADAMVMGQVMTCTPRKGRTQPRNAAYWAGLQQAVAATDAWPTAGHLHDDLKRLCGYVDHYHNPLSGRDEVRVQSTAFNRMSESEFAAFFRLAQMRFVQRMGFDPWVQDGPA